MQSDDVDELSGLLDDALGDFSRVPKQTPKCSDDDLDEFLAPIDAEATRKAALNFENMIKKLAEQQTLSNDTPCQTDTSAASHEFLSNLLGINQLLNDEEADPQIKMLTETILKECFTKDVILPLITKFREIIDEYLEDKTVEISDGERKGLLEQKKIFDELIQSYESLSNMPTNAEVEHQNSLWIKLKDLGEVPPAIISRFESKLQTESGGLEGIMPSLGNDISQCSIM